MFEDLDPGQEIPSYLVVNNQDGEDILYLKCTITPPSPMPGGKPYILPLCGDYCRSQGTVRNNLLHIEEPRFATVEDLGPFFRGVELFSGGVSYLDSFKSIPGF